jgi:hypothetical protein
MRFRIGAVECNRLARQRFGRTIRQHGRVHVSRREALVTAREGGIEVDGPLKVLLCERVLSCRLDRCNALRRWPQDDPVIRSRYFNGLPQLSRGFHR